MAGGLTTTIDLTRLAERLADRLERGGADHPVAAAVALACRGRTGRDLESFASWIGLSAEAVRACEAGDVPFGDLPTELVAEHHGLDLFALADLDGEVTRRRTSVPPGNRR